MPWRTFCAGAFLIEFGVCAGIPGSVYTHEYPIPICYTVQSREGTALPFETGNIVAIKPGKIAVRYSLRRCPSGRGLKIWARGSLPANLPGVSVGDGAIELYDHCRYFTVTGRAFRGAPLEIEDHATDLLKLYGRLTAGSKGWPLQPLPGGLIPHGQQHNTLVSLCGTLRARGICEEAIENCLQIVNAKQCERPGPREHITRIVLSSRKWARQ